MEKRELDSCLCRIADGDMEALARLYQHFYRPVYLLAVSRTSDPSLAEDIAQEVFLTIRTQAASYESGNARSWIFRHHQKRHPVFHAAEQSGNRR